MPQLDLQTVSPSLLALQEGELEIRSIPFLSKGEDIDLCRWWGDGRGGSTLTVGLNDLGSFPTLMIL